MGGSWSIFSLLRPGDEHVAKKHRDLKRVVVYLMGACVHVRARVLGAPMQRQKKMLILGQRQFQAQMLVALRKLQPHALGPEGDGAVLNHVGCVGRHADVKSLEHTAQNLNGFKHGKTLPDARTTASSKGHERKVRGARHANGL